jgi:LmbE family N-acetylglucosaminyl deacetylase
MRALQPRPRDWPLRVLCLGAHSDDIEIGCGGTILTLARANPRLAVEWVPLAPDSSRRYFRDPGGSTP